MKYFYKIDEAHPYKWDNVCKVELWSGWNANRNQESRIDTVATIASLSYGNEEAKNPHRLYKKLQQLKHESVFEFVNMPTTENRKLSSLRHIPDLACYEEFEIENNKEQAVENLIDYHKSLVATFKVTVPIFVARQFMRHCCFSYLEMSRRYVKDSKVPFKFYDIPELTDEMIERTRKFYNEAILLYKDLINSGVRPERARSVIPIGSYTTFYAQGNIECLRNFFNLRLKKDAQEDIRLVSEKMLELLKQHQEKLYLKLKI